MCQIFGQVPFQLFGALLQCGWYDVAFSFDARIWRDVWAKNVVSEYFQPIRVTGQMHIKFRRHGA
jgi:hypothetical protein